MTEKSLTRKMTNPKSLFCDRDENKKQSVYSKTNILSKTQFLEYAVLHWKFNPNIEKTYLDIVYSYYCKIYSKFKVSMFKRGGKYANMSFSRIFKDFGRFDSSAKNVTIQYYTNRGYSKLDSIEMLNKRQNTFAKMSEDRKKEFKKTLSNSLNSHSQIEKHGITKYKEICKNKGKSMNATYLSKKHKISIQEAKRLVFNKAKSAGDESARMIREGEIVVINNTNIEYYTNKGLSLFDANIALSNRQSTFSYKKCIEKYGKSRGEVIFKERQIKWQKTLNDKSEEEKLDILTRRFSHNNKKFFSNESKIFFEKMLEIIPSFSTNTLYAELEYFIYDIEKKGVLFYDFVDIDNKIIIEYNGSHVHAHDNNKSTFKPIWNKSLTWDIVKEKDDHKIKVAKNKGFNVIVVWDFESLETKIQKINNALNL